MAVFTKTVVDTIPYANGLIMEYGTWADLNSDGTGTITAATSNSTTVGSSKVIDTIIQWGFASDGDYAVKPARDVYNNQVKITCQAGDAGDYYIIGKAH